MNESILVLGGSPIVGKRALGAALLQNLERGHAGLGAELNEGLANDGLDKGAVCYGLGEDVEAVTVVGGVGVAFTPNEDQPVSGVMGIEQGDGCQVSFTGINQSVGNAEAAGNVENDGVVADDVVSIGWKGWQGHDAGSCAQIPPEGTLVVICDPGTSKVGAQLDHELMQNQAQREVAL